MSNKPVENSKGRRLAASAQAAVPGRSRLTSRPRLSAAPDVLPAMYRHLAAAYGPQHWWPAESPTEVVIGAILTQNTAWTNVERAIANLRKAGKLCWAALRALPEKQLAELIRPAGTFRVKAARLRAFVNALWKDHGGVLESMLAGELETVRARLLAIHGIGPETADAILLYAGGCPSFVVDAYTRRILLRHRLIDPGAGYEEIRRLFHSTIPADPVMYNEYHALIVGVGKRHCRATAVCEGCPLADFPHDSELGLKRNGQTRGSRPKRSQKNGSRSGRLAER